MLLWHRRGFADTDERLEELPVQTMPLATHLTCHGLDRVDVVQVANEGTRDASSGSWTRTGCGRRA